ncbi:MAG: hypothetical protein ACTSWA_07425 [Candidatus Thorarchaeota archaeon]
MSCYEYKLMKIFIASVLIVLILCPCSRETIHSATSGNSDLLIAESTVTIKQEYPLVLNLSTFENEGYYGRVISDKDQIRLTIISRVDLERKLRGEEVVPILERVGRKISRWEFLSYRNQNISVIYELLSTDPVSISYSIWKDLTPPQIWVSYKRYSLFPPRYNVTIKFTGGFFDHAKSNGPTTNIQNYWYSNESFIWMAFQYNSSSRCYIIIPDGKYNFTITAWDRLERYTTEIFSIHKTSNAEVGIVIMALLSASFLGSAIEIVRRWYIQSERQRDHSTI